jgi:hypothetical protein
MSKSRSSASRGSSKDVALKGKPKKMMPLFALTVFVVMGMQYSRLDESKKRFIKHLAKQVPYLPGRYYA